MHRDFLLWTEVLSGRKEVKKRFMGGGVSVGGYEQGVGGQSM
ncbi:MAG: hypothetical protein VYA53_05620 [Acidobacteriota bacterium]|nr:hypothetical protein [Acidobacteriota bacterium]